MQQDDSNESSVRQNKSEHSSGKLPQKATLNIEDIQDCEDESRRKDSSSPGSPTKLIKTKMNQQPQEEDPVMTASKSRVNRRRPKTSTKLEPFKGLDPQVIDISEQVEKSDVKTEERSTVRLTKVQRDKPKRVRMLVFDDDEAIPKKQEEEDSRPERQQQRNRQLSNLSEASSQEEAPQENSQQQNQQQQQQQASQNTSSISNEAILNMVAPQSTINLVMKRDQLWLNKLRPQFNMHYKQTNQYCFSAKMTSSNTSTTIIVSKSQTDFTENGPNYIGKFKGSFTGSQFNIYGPGYNPENSKEKDLPLRKLLATIEYETNFFGSTRPRNFKVFVLRPGVCYYNDLIGTKKYSQQIPLSELYEKPQNQNKIFVLVNRKPEWNEEIKGFMLNFSGKVKMASIKNFILQDQINPEQARMIFGKIDNDDFHLQLGHPLSPFVGVGIALSAFGSKIGCE